MTYTLLGILLPAFCAGVLVLVTHVPLGRLVLERGIIFIDLAIAQVAGLGVVAADAAGFAPHGWSVQISALSAALLAAAGLLIWTERRLGACPGSDHRHRVRGRGERCRSFVLSFNAHGAEHLKDLLVGQILLVSMEELWPVALLYAGVLGGVGDGRSAPAARGVLRDLRHRHHRLGAARRRVPGVRVADRAGGGGARTARRAAMRLAPPAMWSG